MFRVLVKWALALSQGKLWVYRESKWKSIESIGFLSSETVVDLAFPDLSPSVERRLR